VEALYFERAKNAQRGVGANQALYRHELGHAAASRQEQLKRAEDASRRIAELLPGARQAGLSIAEISRLTGYSRPTLYRLLAEARPQQDLAAEFQRLAEELKSASAQIGHPALRDEFAKYLDIEIDELCGQLTRLFSYSVERLNALGSLATVSLVDLLPDIPDTEKIILTQMFFHRLPIEEIIRSINRPGDEVVVWAVLALLRVLPEIEAC
jgi:hypothetical protein